MNMDNHANVDRWWQNKIVTGVIVALVGLGFSLCAGALTLSALGYSTRFIILVSAVFTAFILIPLLTGTVGAQLKFTPRRTIALFGVIPALTVAVVVLLKMANVSESLRLYICATVVVVATFAYWRWFDTTTEGSGPRGGS